MSTHTCTRVLVVEDDPSIARLLELELRHRAMEVTVAGAGPAGLEHAATGAYDVVLLDMLLPEMDGERVLDHLRREGNRTPVIMVTARDADHDKIRNLDHGADDYVTKPFNVDELVSRMRAVMRRTAPIARLQVADLVMDIDARTVVRGDTPIDLTQREFDLLGLLMANPRVVIPRHRILDEIWSERPDVDPGIIDVYIGYLRKKIDLPGMPRLINTVRGVGYVVREPSR